MIRLTLLLLLALLVAGAGPVARAQTPPQAPGSEAVPPGEQAGSSPVAITEAQATEPQAAEAAAAAGVESQPADSPRKADSPRESAPRQAAEWLPADTLFFARVADLGQFREQWRQSSFGAQAEDPAFAEFFAAVVDRISAVTGGAGLDLTELWTEVDGELSLAVVRNSADDLSLVAVADFGDPASAAAMLDRYEAKLVAESAESTTVETAHAELKSWRRGGNRTLSNISYFAEGGTVVFSDQLQTLAETARAGYSADSESLADNPEFQHVAGRVVPAGETSGANWYLNPTQVIAAAVDSRMVGNPNPQVVRSLIDRLGLEQFRGFGGSFYIGKAGMDSVSSTYGHVDTPVEGLWRAVTLPATSQRPPDWVKDDVSLYSQFNWGADRFYETLQTLVDRTSGEGSFEANVGQRQIGDSGMTVREFVQHLQGPVHIAAEIPTDARQLTQQRAIFAIDVQDAAELRELVGDYAAGAGAETLTAGGQQVFHFQPDVPAFGDLPPLSFAVAVTDEALMFSPSAEYLSQTLGERQALRPLADSPEYQEIADQFPERTSMITYQHQDARMAGLYEQLRAGVLSTGLPGLSGQLMQFDFSKLPPWPAMSRYLQTTGSFAVPEEDGFRIVSFALPPREQ